MAWQDGKSGQSARPPQRLVFMPNFSNPLKDSKRSENRKMVAKWAMINRPKAALNPVTPPGSSSSAQNTSRAPTDSISLSPPVAAPLTPESLPSTTPLLNQNDSGDRYDPGYRPPPFGFISKSTSDYYSLPAEEGDLSLPPQEKTDQAQTRVAEARQRHQAKLKVNRRRLQEPKQSLTPPFDDDEYDTITEVIRRPEQMHEQALIQSNTVTFLPSGKDPFDCLPIKHNPHTQELLYLYLNAHFLSPAFTQGSIEIPQRVKTYRQLTWFPLILESKATLNALVAYIESTPDLPVKSRSPDFLISHVQAAYEGMRYALSNPKTETDDSICIAVILLMLTAQRLGDIGTFRAHATGLMHLLAARSKAFRSSRFLRDRETERWQSLNLKINGPPNPDPCKYCQDAHLRPSRSTSPDSPVSSPPPVPSEDPSLIESTSADAKIVPSQSRGSGFYDLIARGYLSPRMSGFVEQILIWSSLAEQARRDRLSAAAAATHAWVDERPGKIPPLDTACQFSVRICLYLSSWLEGGHSCSIVRRMAMAAYGSLRNPLLDVSSLLEECPQILLWVSFVAGPFVEDDMARQWFMCLLVRARHAVAPLGDWDIDELLGHMSSLFLWTNTMTSGVRRFCDENSWDVGTATAWMESPF